MTLAADAHTTHDKPHAPGARIREHHNATLPAISSFGVRIQALPAAAIDFPAGAGPDGSELLSLLVTRTMPFGKYQGRLIADLPGPYLAWFARRAFRPASWAGCWR